MEEALTSQPRLRRADRQGRSSVCRAADFYEGLRNYENILMEGGDGADSDEDDGQPSSDSSER